MNDFLFNSDYPIDKVIWTWEGDVPASGYAKTIAHGLGAVPFCKGIATTDNWNTTISSGAGTLDASAQNFNNSLDIGSDGTNVYIWWYGTATAKVRVWGVFDETTTQNVDAAPTAQVSDGKFIFNTDYKYPALVKEGTVDVSSANVTITHNLGYIPVCDIWAYNNSMGGSNKWFDKINNAVITQFNGVDTDVKISSTNIVFKKASGSPSTTKYYYRIYAYDTTL